MIHAFGVSCAPNSLIAFVTIEYPGTVKYGATMMAVRANITPNNDALNFIPLASSAKFQPSAFEQSRGVILFSFAYSAAAFSIIGRTTSRIGSIQSLISFHSPPSHCWMMTDPELS